MTFISSPSKLLSVFYYLFRYLSQHLGIQVAAKAYPTLLKTLKGKKGIARASLEERSDILDELVPTTRSIGRRNGKTRNNLTKKLTDLKREHV